MLAVFGSRILHLTVQAMSSLAFSHGWIELSARDYCQMTKKPSPIARTSARKTKRGKYEIHLQRVYDKSAVGRGTLFLVDRIWPRGIKKTELAGAKWLPEVAPTTALRKWFGHEPPKWMEFRRRYLLELKGNTAALKPLTDASQADDITLLFSARDLEMNQAVVLKEFLEGKMG
jgi:uncharacterized protein YeaO (DUF488 family)